MISDLGRDFKRVSARPYKDKSINCSLSENMCTVNPLLSPPPPLSNKPTLPFSGEVSESASLLSPPPLPSP